MDRQLKRILDLVRRTGDRMVVTDVNGEDVYVVMGLEQYERLVSRELGEFGETEERRNRGTKEPRNEGTEELETIGETPHIWDTMASVGAGADTWDLEHLTDAERAELERQFAQYQAQFSAPPVENTEKKGEAQKTKDEPTEEQFYLEPVE